MQTSPGTGLGTPWITDSIDLSTVPLELKVRLLTGATAWTLHTFPEAGLRPLVVSDGPIGVRGVDDDPTPSAQLPSPSAVAASWDLDLVARLGSLVADEAKRKGTDVVLAPVVNLQRTPVGGRHFECYSEDPYLTSRVGSSFIAAAQDRGVGMSVKHFAGNESETDRTTYVARIDERTMREVYLAPFEHAVRNAGVWSVMAAYNQVDDGVQTAPSTEHGRLLNDVLKGEWGFDGVVVSDWLATNTTVESAVGGLDLVMPGPGGPWEEKLAAAVRAGDVPESVIDDKVRRILRLGERVGAIGDEPTPLVDPDLPFAPETRALLREAVARSIVLLRNEDSFLPLDPGAVATVALIGPNAVEPFVQGGGSAFVDAPYLSTAEDAIRAALPNAVVTVHRGGTGRRHAHPIGRGLVSAPDGTAGYELTLLDAGGDPLGAATIVEARESWNRHVPLDARKARIRASVRLSTPGVHRLEVGLSGAHRVWFGEELVSRSTTIVGHDVILDSSANHPDGPSRRFAVDEVSGPVTVEIHAEVQVVDAAGYGTFVRFELRHEPNDPDVDGEIAEAVEAARLADVAVVIIGTNEETESEGWDRPDLQLPGRQNELVRRVAEANPRTVVVVNAGGPLILPWLDEVAAVLWWWLPGQEAGNGLADALLGTIEPGGRLPWTLPASEADVPVPHALPVDGVIEYTEGIDVGHRGWDRLDRTPARPFGFGLGYTTFSSGPETIEGWDGDELIVTVPVTNTGSRPGRAIPQLYLEDVTSPVDRPVRWLAGFTIADLEPGHSAGVRIAVPRRAFEIWNVQAHSWDFATGPYTVRTGASSRDLSDGVTVDMSPPTGHAAPPDA
ncbi:beta-glucosidase family protein [Diaminobutyricibacter sp. McL0608]|uniref:beta-glucosidase family protein n=1 Tax=Leifsonia sp. McL0608 TaxID=3143537 RepID=UPI0031F2DF40